MLTRIVLLFILLPLADLILMLMLARTHWQATVLWIVVTALFGIWCMRRQGTYVVRQMRVSLNQNQVPGDVIMEGVIVVFAGLLLILPGLITDLFGLSLLFRPARRWYRNQFVAWLKKHVTAVKYDMRQAGSDSDVVDATVVGRRSNRADAGSDSIKLPSQH